MNELVDCPICGRKPSILQKAWFCMIHCSWDGRHSIVVTENTEEKAAEIWNSMEKKEEVGRLVFGVDD